MKKLGGWLRNLILVVSAMLLSGVADNQTTVTRHAVEGEFFIEIASTTLTTKEVVEALADTLTKSTQIKPFLPKSRPAGSAGWYFVKTSAAFDMTVLKQAGLAGASIRRIQPNYEYKGDPREYEPNDPQLSDQYHHEVMKNREAWNVSMGDASVVVAITDDGIELGHEDLAGSLWVNEGEIPANGIDDEGNGYVDDVHGYDIISGDADPNPEPGNYHGTHVAGIVAAVAGNEIGIAGTAPNVKLMAIKFYGGGQWTSRVIAESYMYAADNGADIITTSYNINSFVGDAIFEAATLYAYEKGVLHFNSAGNGYERNPARQAFDELVLTCSTIADDVDNDQKSNFSNYGWGIDLCAPGGGGAAGILSTYGNNSYRRLSGTSMAAPNAAAVAALIWSMNPGWTRDQVAARLFASADNIDERNSSIAGLLGAGRVNSERALAMVQPYPTLGGIVGLSAEGELMAPVQEISVEIRHVLDAGSLNQAGAFSLERRGADGLWQPAGIALSPAKPYKIGTQRLQLGLSADLSSGAYRLIGHAAIIEDPFGQALDGDGDGLEGDDWQVEFRVP